jgi:hypothetical protein
MYLERFLYSEMASALGALARCKQSREQSNNEEFLAVNKRAIDMWESRIKLFESHLPSGSGFDNGTKINFELSHEDKLVFETSYHHMNDGGFYDGWTHHVVTVVPSLTCDFHIRVSGINRNQIKDYIAEVFEHALRQEMTYWLFLERFPQFKVRSEWKDQSTQIYFVDGFAGLHEFAHLDKAIRYASELMQNAFLNQVVGKELKD